MFNVGDELSSQEVVERLGITRRMWDTKRQKYLDYLSKFYEIETKGYGMSRRYFIKRQLAEFEPYVSPRDKKIMEKRYQEVILDEMSKPGMELQLYSTMNNRVIASGKTGKFGHSDKTSYNYVNSGMKQMFGEEVGDWGSCGKYVDRVWAKQLFDEEYDFERLSEAEERNWKKIIKENMDTNYTELYSMYEHHEISKESAMSEMFENGWYKYQCAKQAFYELYGFVPVRVKEYLVEAKKHLESKGFVD